MSLARSLVQGSVLLGKYRVDSIIGRGGMGLVVKAWHLGLEEDVAIKLLRDDLVIADETIARFIREAQAAVKLKSEHVARITDVGTLDDGKPYMVMELLEGQDIGQLLTERGRLLPSLAIDLVIQACEALAEAHSLGIVHRDIKPTNLFLTSRPDGSLLLKVLDFGISKSPAGAELSLTQTWSMLGSPAYMSPEQMRSARHVDGRTDIWSLGAVLYEAVEGHLPFLAESFSEMCVMVAVDPPTPMTAAPPELAAIITRCLTKDPAQRYANVAELGKDLARLAREPDKAQILVDRMYRMLGRGTVRRTPPAGVPQTGQALYGKPTAQRDAMPPTPTPGSSPTAQRDAMPQRPSGFLPAPAGFVPTPPGFVPAPPGFVPTPPGFVPTPPGFVPTPPGFVLTPPGFVPTPPGVVLAPPGFVPTPPGIPVTPPPYGDPRYPVPGMHAVASVTATYAMARPERNWALVAVTALVALAAALAVVAATRDSAAPAPQTQAPSTKRSV
ncbi:MAG: protein kinase [Kofleriaceae bacterium]